MDAISQIKSRLSIEDLVAQYIPLKKAGRNFKALCPFHKERTPSFVVSPERQLAYCFGCHKGGDQFKFVCEIEGVDFRGALTLLAEKTGVELPKKLPEDRFKKTERDRLIELHEKATAYFEEKLLDSPDGKKVLTYLNKRGFKEKIIRHGRLGFAPDDADGLYTHLLKKDFTRDEIIASGLVIARDTQSEKCVDRFRMRLIFPIHNLSGSICAFGGRAVREGDEPKYLNSPETPIYNKSSILYGLAGAKTSIRQKASALLVEGYMDALACVQAGITNAVACSGTALTEDHLRLITRFTKTLLCAFDRDEAGKLATFRALELGLSQNLELKVVTWPGDAKDPDEALRDDAKKFINAIENPMAATDYLLNSVKDQFSKTVDGKRQMVQVILPFIAAVASPVAVDEWIKQCAGTFDISVTALYDEFKSFKLRQKNPIASSYAASKLSEASIRPKSVQLEEYFIGLLLTYTEFFGIANQLVKIEDFEDIELQNIYRDLTTEYNQTLARGGEISGAFKVNGERADLLAMYVESKNLDMNWGSLEQELQDTAYALVRLRFDREKRLLINRLKTASKSETAQLLETYQELLIQEYGQKAKKIHHAAER